MTTKKRTKRSIAIVGGKGAGTALLKLLAQHDRIRRTGEYDILGQVEQIGVEQIEQDATEPMKFYGAGPVIARGREDGTLLFLTDWKGLPAKISLGDDPCPDCLTDCDLCKKTGKVTCTLANGCRGTGVQKILRGQCRCVRNVKGVMRAKARCRHCAGAGLEHDKRECPGCKGTKLEPCSQCRGNGRYSTGKRGGTTGMKDLLCLTCNGNQRELLRDPQDLAKLVTAKPPAGLHLEIKGVAWLTWRDMSSGEGTGDPRAGLQVCTISPDSGGHLMTLVVDKASNIYCIGGVPQLVN